MTSPVREMLRTRRGAFGATAGVILLIALVIRGWAGYRGYFLGDDFAFTGRAARYGLSGDLLFRDYNSHFMPAAFVWVWATTSLWPLQFAPVVTVCLILQLATGVVFYRLLVDLFGYRLVVLVALTVFVLTPITLPAALWWAAALNQLPQQLAMALALFCHVRYLRTGRLSWGLSGVGAIAFGLAFSERTLLMVTVIIAFTGFYATGGRGVARVAALWGTHWRVWLGYLVLVVPYAVFYIVAIPAPAHRQTTGGDAAQVAGAALGHTLAPGLLGGPWTWRPIGLGGAIAAPGKLAAWLSGLACAVLIVGTVAWWRRAMFAWLIVFGYIALDVALLASSRATIVGPTIGDEYRYFTDVGMIAALAIALAIVPISGSFERGDVQRLRPRTAVRAAAGQLPRDVLGWTTLRPVVRFIVVAALVAGYIVSSTISVAGYDRYWHPNPARAYLANARAELLTAQPSLVLYDDLVPQDVAWAVLLYPYSRYSLFFAPLPRPPRTLQYRSSAEQLAVFDQTGHLRLVALAGVGGLPGPKSGCGWRIGSRPVNIDLTRPSGFGEDVLRVGYIANRDGTLSITVGQTRQEVPMHAGLHAVFLLVRGSASSVTLQVGTADTVLCTDDVTVGRPVGVPGTRP